jgi:hypothetical protein
MDHGTQGYCLTKNTEGQKSRETVSLICDTSALRHNAEFFGIERSRKKIVLPLLKLFKEQSIEKSAIGDLTCIMAVK